MKGYNYPRQALNFTLVEVDVPVACRRCNNYWHEKVVLPRQGPRINGPHHYYDFCDKCIIEGDKASAEVSGVKE